MSHPQALHTSCRVGLTSRPGFQFNAASPSLDRAALAQLAARHAGYHVPRDMPLEPTADELARFPVSLKVAPVDGVGTVVSRTTYVGREFRGRDGEPDEGRFGNYFSHIVAGGAPDDPFDGLLGIELWDAPHWTDVESREPTLPELGPLRPGPLDVDRVIAALSSAPRRLLAEILDGAIGALDGGPRLVVVDPECERAAAWIGWISYALPTAQARRLTFTTFDGRPRYADDVHVCVTTPSCDIAFAQHEVGRSVHLVDVTAGAQAARSSLHARVALALVEQATDALAGAVRSVPSGATGDRRGAWLAVVASQTELVEGDELAAVVELLGELAENGHVELAAATAKQLPADAPVDRAVLPSWAGLHRAARHLPTDESSRSLAETALARIVPFAGELPGDLPEIAPDAPTHPGVGNLAPWLGRVEAAAADAACEPLVSDGLRLGLVGVNAAVDRRLAHAIAEGLEHSGAKQALRAIGRLPTLEHIVVDVTEIIADRAPQDDRARELTRELAHHSVALATLKRRAAEHPDFARSELWLRCEVDRDPSRSAWAARTLVAQATEDRHRARIRQLWGVDGPQAPGEHVELLGAYTSAGAQPPFADALRALDALMRLPMNGASSTADVLGATLSRCDERVRGHPSYLAWWAVANRPGTTLAFSTWAPFAARALVADARDVPEDRWDELCQTVCREIVRVRRAHDYAEGVVALRARSAEEIDDGLVYVLEKRLRGCGEGAPALVAELFMAWRAVPGHAAGLVHGVLMRVCGTLRRRDLESVAELLAPELHEEWEQSLEHMPRSAVARALTRRGRRAKDEGAER